MKNHENQTYIEQKHPQTGILPTSQNAIPPWQFQKLSPINKIVFLWHRGFHFDSETPISIVECFYEVTLLLSRQQEGK